ncbi:DUF72 domain-containing protein [Phaeocystidibacter luteus]|uniref:DUF72 domain-containing protein n=1 Tax=Phaeocystidibacter luteus TaxID=911197 RepID=A0A6N6RJR1_9FLAO|nr:DUF72 domain-containing protein [Phaeocystidibacter luteus]KAB2813910.1 DUF72 domain-containing protein [Phaeocystidibacter luteus]
MKFGKVEPSREYLAPLPNDHAIVMELEPSPGLTVHLGGTQWGMKEWVGQWYPPGTPQKGYLSAYTQQFSCTELNATHYRTFAPEQVAEWAKQSASEFKFLPKLPQSISHYRRLKNAEEPTALFAESIRPLGEHLGPCFLQMPENYKAEKARDLFDYLEAWPDDIHLALELRHPSWFDDQTLFDDITATLHNKNMNWVLTDAPGRPDVLHMASASKQLMLRYAGWDFHPLEVERIAQWAEKFAQWESTGITDVYLCIHQPSSLRTPESAIQFAAEIKKAKSSIRVTGTPSPLSLF